MKPLITNLSLREQIVEHLRNDVLCGRLAEGDLRTVLPRLAGQHPGYLLRQLTETAAGARPSMDEAHRKRIGALSDAERAAVAEYLAQLSPGLSSVP